MEILDLRAGSTVGELVTAKACSLMTWRRNNLKKENAGRPNMDRKQDSEVRHALMPGVRHEMIEPKDNERSALRKTG